MWFSNEKNTAGLRKKSSSSDGFYQKVAKISSPTFFIKKKLMVPSIRIRMPSRRFPTNPYAHVFWVYGKIIKKKVGKIGGTYRLTWAKFYHKRRKKKTSHHLRALIFWTAEEGRLVLWKLHLHTKTLELSNPTSTYSLLVQALYFIYF